MYHFESSKFYELVAGSLDHIFSSTNLMVILPCPFHQNSVSCNWVCYRRVTIWHDQSLHF